MLYRSLSLKGVTGSLVYADLLLAGLLRRDCRRDLQTPGTARKMYGQYCCQRRTDCPHQRATGLPPARLEAFGEALVKRWLERIIVWEDHFTVELKSGLNMDTAEEDMNEYEFKVVWALSELANVKWWHRNISRLGFQINGPVHAYPDIIVMLHSGKILMVETKGDHLDNDESKEKAKIGDQWAKLAGKQYKYYMVFETKQPDYPGAYSLERFMEIVNGL